MAEIDVRVPSSKTPEQLFPYLLDASTWPTWGPFRTATLERQGTTDPNGVGAIRVFTTSRKEPSREEVVEVVPNRRLAYTLLSGMPFKAYRSEVELTPKDGGSEVRWHSVFEPNVPGTGWFWQLALGRFLKKTAEQLAAAG